MKDGDELGQVGIRRIGARLQADADMCAAASGHHGIEGPDMEWVASGSTLKLVQQIGRLPALGEARVAPAVEQRSDPRLVGSTHIIHRLDQLPLPGDPCRV